MARPYWSGQIRISLVGLEVDVYPATRRSSQVPLHEYDRNTGERIRHRNVNDDGNFVEDDDIIKGYEFTKNDYVLLEQEEIDKLKLPSSDALELTEFVEAGAITLLRYERPYTIMPKKKADETVYQVLAEALRESGMAGIGQITLRGREELCAIVAYDKGLMLETLRYDAELQKPEESFEGLGEKKIKKDQVQLAKRLIEQNTDDPHFERYHDHYHEALLDLIEAKKEKRKPKFLKTTGKQPKVIDFMDALQKSLKAGGKSGGKPEKAHKSSVRHARGRG